MHVSKGESLGMEVLLGTNEFSLEKVLYWVIPSWAGQVGDW